MKKLLDSYSLLVLPGSGEWPSYLEADTRRYWDGWESRTPLSTRYALYFSVLAIHVYCVFFSLWGKSRQEAFAASEDSSLYLLRQAFTMIKTIACLAYFSDPKVHALSRKTTDKVLVWQE